MIDFIMGFTIGFAIGMLICVMVLRSLKKYIERIL